MAVERINLLGDGPRLKIKDKILETDSQAIQSYLTRVRAVVNDLDSTAQFNCHLGDDRYLMIHREEDPPWAFVTLTIQSHDLLARLGKGYPHTGEGDPWEIAETRIYSSNGGYIAYQRFNFGRGVLSIKEFF